MPRPTPVCLPSAGLDRQPAMSQPVFPLEGPRIASTAPPRSRSQMQMQTPGSTSKRFARTAAQAEKDNRDNRLRTNCLQSTRISLARQAPKDKSQAAKKAGKG